MKAIATLFIMALAVSAFSSTPPKLVIVTIATEQNGTRYRINDREVPTNDIQRLLGKLAEIDKSQALLIEADDNTTLKTIIDFITLCRNKGFSSIRVFSNADTGQTREIIIGSTTNTVEIGDEKTLESKDNVTLPVPLLFGVGNTSEPPAIVPTGDRPENSTNHSPHRTAAELAPMTEQERNYYKDNAKGKDFLK